MMVGRLVSFFVLGPGNLSAGFRADTLRSCIRICVFSWGNPFRDYSFSHSHGSVENCFKLQGNYFWKGTHLPLNHDYGRKGKQFSEVF